MAKHPRKKQKTADAPMQPLGSAKHLDDDEEKDDEERRLESILFGKPYKPSGGKFVLEISDQSADELHEDGVGNEMEQLRDTDLFFVDDGAPSAPIEIPDLDVDEPSDNDAAADQQQAEESSSNDEKSSSDDSDETSEDDEPEKISAPTERQPLKPGVPKCRKTAVWTDPDDTNITVSLGTNKRLRKLRDAPGEDAVGGAQYEAKLRREYERIHAPPAWAAAARKKLHADGKSQTKRRRSAAALSDEDEDGSSSALDDNEGRRAGTVDDMETLLASSSGIVKESKGKLLAKGTLAIERLRDANQSARAEGDIKGLAFHPSPKVPVLMVASGDRRLKLFNVDGHTNPHLQTIHIPSLPFTTALFHPTGTSVLLTGQRPFYYTHDLQSGATTRSPRGLWGSFASNNPSKDSDMSMEKCAFDATGEVLAVAGRKGYVHLVDWKSGGAQVVGSVKMNTPVKALWWTRGDASRTELMTLGEDAEVYVWNVGERRCVKRWKDDGGFGSVVMSGDNGGRYLGIGSKTGLVNVYGSDSLSSNVANTPRPLKTLTNLTTSISTLRFNHDSQLLAISSNTKKDQMRLIHLASLTSFSNWPTSSTPLGHVNAIDFSAGSEYIAVGNNRGRVLLYHLPHFVAH